MSDVVSRFDSLPSALINTTVAGDAVAKLISTPTNQRRAVTICNNDTSASLWVTPVTKGASAPTIAATSYLFGIAPTASITVQVSGGVDFYGMNSSGDSTTSYYTAQEWR